MPPACRLRSITSICEWMPHGECCVKQRKASSRSRWMWATAIPAISRNSSEEKQSEVQYSCPCCDCTGSACLHEQHCVRGRQPRMGQDVSSEQQGQSRKGLILQQTWH